MDGPIPRLAAFGLSAAMVLTISSCGARVASGAPPGGRPTRRPIGCTSGGFGRPVSNGPSRRRQIALSFDDGPSSHYTSVMLEILRRLHARATFFEVGKHVERRPGRTLELFRSGMEIGNHSFTHPHHPGFRQLAATDREVHAVTGFTPCLFRPPYGIVDPLALRAARRAHLRLVLWDLDSHDFKNPPTADIRNRVLRLARPGSIVDMHDGGNDRQHTAAALPQIIRGLRSRGYRFVTVTQILGDRFVYRR